MAYRTWTRFRPGVAGMPHARAAATAAALPADAPAGPTGTPSGNAKVC